MRWEMSLAPSRASCREGCREAREQQELLQRECESMLLKAQRGLQAREAEVQATVVAKGQEGQAIKWVRAKDLRDYPMPPADEPLIPILQDLL